MADKRPFFVLVPGASHNPAHYGYLCHLLMQAGYPVFSSTLPSVGNPEKITVDDDVEYVRKNMLIPVLDTEEHDAILVMHSYSGVPGSAAAKGFSKAERAAQGKKTGVIGQIFLSAVLVKGGDGTDILSGFGGNYPPHLRADTEANLLRCDDRIPPLYHDAPADMVDAAAVAAMAQGITSFTSPCPPASWNSKDFEKRVAFIRTLQDHSIPLQVQQMMLDGSGVDWIIKDIDSSHTPQLSQPEKLAGLFLNLAKDFEAL